MDSSLKGLELISDGSEYGWFSFYEESMKSMSQGGWYRPRVSLIFRVLIHV